MKVYMEVSQDGLELPVAMADSMAELAKMTGTSAALVRSSVSKMRRGVHKTNRFVEVEIDEREDADE